MSAEAYQQQIIALADSSDARVQALHAQYLRGALTLDQLVEAASAVLAASNSAGRTLAASLLAVQVARGTRQRFGLFRPTRPQGERDRLRDSLRQVVEEVPDFVAAVEDEAQREAALQESQRARLTRISRDEPLEASVSAMDEGVTHYGKAGAVRGWFRRLDADPCPTCRKWAAEGRVYRASDKIFRHAQCGCVPEPVFRRS